MYVYRFIIHFTDKKLFSIQFINHSIFNTLYGKFHIISWFSQKSFVDFCQILMPPAELRSKLTNKRPSDISAGWYFHLSPWGRWKWKNKDVCGNFAWLLVTRVTSLMNWIIVLKYYQENMASLLCVLQIQLSTWYTFVSFFLNWSIVDLQCCVNYCCTAKWLSYTYICIRFHIVFHYGLSQDSDYSSLCYIVGPCCSPVLYIPVCMC